MTVSPGIPGGGSHLPQASGDPSGLLLTVSSGIPGGGSYSPQASRDPGGLLSTVSSGIPGGESHLPQASLTVFPGIPGGGCHPGGLLSTISSGIPGGGSHLPQASSTVSPGIPGGGSHLPQASGDPSGLLLTVSSGIPGGGSYSPQACGDPGGLLSTVSSGIPGGESHLPQASLTVFPGIPGGGCHPGGLLLTVLSGVPGGGSRLPQASSIVSPGIPGGGSHLPQASKDPGGLLSTVSSGISEEVSCNLPGFSNLEKVLQSSRYNWYSVVEFADDQAGRSEFEPAFLNHKTDEAKKIECIRVDGAADEGPSHEEVQFWWTARHLEAGKLVTLMNSRSSASSYLNKVELQNCVLSLRHANLFIPSTLNGTCIS